MPKSTDRLLSYIRAVAGVWLNDPRDDIELLNHFAETRDEMAFAALVGRHGGLVWQTCRRLLRDTSDVEDAFQTVFLALARKAGRSNIKSPASWLHCVARRTALDIRYGVERRQRLENKLQSIARPEAQEDLAHTKLYPVLDEELANLPEKLRVPLLLHYLEGKSQVEVAKILGCARNALQKRLAKGEAILRERLERRGLTLSALSVAALLGNAGGSPAVSASLIASTAQAAVAFRAGTLTGVTADTAQKLLKALAVEGGLRTSWWTLLAGLCCLGIGGAGLVVWRMNGVGPDAGAPTVPAVVRTAPHNADARSPNERVDRFGDPLPEGALARIGTLRFRSGRCGERPGMAFLPDGKTLVSRVNESLFFWEWATGKLLRRLDGVHGENLAVSPDGKMLVIGGEYWDLAVNPPRRLKREKLKSLLMDEGSVAFSHDGRIVAWAARDEKRKFVYLVDASTGKVNKILNDAEGQHLAFSPDNKTLAIGGGTLGFQDAEGGGLALWDVSTGTKRLEIARVGNVVSFLAFTPDGRTLLVSTFNGHNILEMFAASDGPERMRFLDVATGEELRRPIAAQASPPFFRMGSKSLSPDGKLIALNNDNSISVWDLTEGREVGPAGGIHFPVDTLMFSADGKKLATLAAAESPNWYVTPVCQVWDSETGRLKKELKLPRTALAISSLHNCSDSRHLEMLYADASHLDLLNRPPLSLSRETWASLRWDICTGKTEKIKDPGIPIDLIPLLKRSRDCCAVSSDGRWQALGLTTGIAIVNRATGKEVHRFSGTQDPNFVTFSADGQSVLTSVGPEKARRLEVWSTLSGKQRISLSDPVDPIPADPMWPNELWSYALSSDGRWLAAACLDYPGDKRVRLIETASGKEWEEFTVGSGMKRVVWSPDGLFFAGGDANGTVWLWDAVTGQEIRHFTTGHLSAVTSLGFSPEGLRLASGSADTTALIWDLRGLKRPADQEKNQSTADILWASLGDKNLAIVRRSIHLLTQRPDESVPLLRERLRPGSPADPKQVAMLVTQLDDNSFQVRNRAMKELVKMGDGIEPTLLEDLTKKPSLEISQSINKILKLLSPPVCPNGLSARQLRACRGVEVLERIGTPAARQVLEELSQLPEGLIQAEEAKAALYRLTKSAPALTK